MASVNEMSFGMPVVRFVSTCPRLVFTPTRPAVVGTWVVGSTVPSEYEVKFFSPCFVKIKVSAVAGSPVAAFGRFPEVSEVACRTSVPGVKAPLNCSVGAALGAAGLA